MCPTFLLQSSGMAHVDWTTESRLIYMVLTELTLVKLKEKQDSITLFIHKGYNVFILLINSLRSFVEKCQQKGTFKNISALPAVHKF